MILVTGPTGSGKTLAAAVTAAGPNIGSVQTIGGRRAELVDLAATAVNRMARDVRLAVPTGFGQMVMSHWLIEFKRLHPSITLELVFDNRVDDLLRDEVDVAVRVMSEPPPGLVARELAPMRHIACASAGFAARHPLPQRLEDLQHLPIVTSTVVGRELRLAAYRGDERRELALQPTLASENFQFLHEAILGDLGVGLVPDYLVAADIAAGRVVTALDDWRLSLFGSRLFLLRTPDRYLALATRTLIDFLLAKAQAWTHAAAPPAAVG